LAGQGSYDSIYHSFQLSAQKRFTGAGSLLSLTPIKTHQRHGHITLLETGVGDPGQYNLRGEQSLSSGRTASLVISYVLDLPFGKRTKYFAYAVISPTNYRRWGFDGVTISREDFPVFTNGG